MTRKEIKELLPIMQAYVDGKTIQYRVNKEWEDIDNPSFNDLPSEYRIKPEPTYRPFKTKEECWNEMLKHQPFGWIKNKNTKYYYNITNIHKTIETVKLVIDNSYAYELSEIFNCFTFIDDIPFGIEE